MAQEHSRFTVNTTADSHFSWLRTRMSMERTLMSWIRTAVSLIGFGFTIVQFFERLSGMEGIAEAARPQAPRYLGLTLIATGVVVLLISLWQYRQIIRYLRGGAFAPLAGVDDEPLQTPTYAASIVLIFIGLFAFVAVLMRAL
ncbi:MAG: YidH family protein [Reyranellaceae bacterium]